MAETLERKAKKTTGAAIQKDNTEGTSVRVTCLRIEGVFLMR